MSIFTPPIRDFHFKDNSNQLFGVNAATYKQFYNDNMEPLPGHNGFDIGWKDKEKMGYGQDILAAHDGIVSLIVTDNEQHTRGNGLYLRGNVQDVFGEQKIPETVYWHLSEFSVGVGQEVKQGQVIGKAGNNGFVMPKPTTMCPYCGTHLHFACRFYTKENVLLRTEYGSGYCDPIPHLYTPGDKLPMFFYRDLHRGMEGDDVSWLQTILKIEGFAKEYNPMGYFGPKTERDVLFLQKRYGISPSIGYFGHITRSFINEKYT